MDIRWAKPWFALTALCAAVGIGISVYTSATHASVFGGSPLNRALNVFAFFTIQSNVLVGIGCLLLWLRVGRDSAGFAVLRMIGLVGITITGIVYHVAIARLVEFDGWALAADQLTHTVVPTMAVAGWLLYGPRGLAGRRTVVLALGFPAAWIVFTLLRGPIVHWYPYHFIDVTSLGYGKVAANCVWIATLYLGASAGYRALDLRLSQGSRTEPV